MSTLVRRLFWLLAIALAGGAGYQWWRERQIPARPDAPEWPPIDVAESTSATSSDEAAETVDDAAESTTDAPEDTSDDAAESTTDAPHDTSGPAEDASGDTDDSSPTIVPTARDEVPAGTASVVNALVDAPDARSTGGDDAPWVAPEADGSCPLSHPIKANDNSGIFHVPDGRFYERTKAERCYVDADAALADGYRQAKS